MVKQDTVVDGVPPIALPMSVTLTGGKVILRTLSSEDGPAIVAATQAQALFQNPLTTIPHADTIDTYLATARAGNEAGHTLAFVTTLADTGELVGATRFFRYDATDRKLELGYTWIAAAWQRSFVNTEAKYLMLRYAFDHLRCMRVEFQTHEQNAVSRQAILRLGATFEGIARKERFMPDGQARNTARFAIIDDDWLQVRAGLEDRLRRAGLTPVLTVESVPRNAISLRNA
jgi:RimJ/RimL family protein N-acetyltransferase